MVAELLLKVLAYDVVCGDRRLNAREHAVEELSQLTDRLAVLGFDRSQAELHGHGQIRVPSAGQSLLEVAQSVVEIVQTACDLHKARTIAERDAQVRVHALERGAELVK